MNAGLSFSIAALFGLAYLLTTDLLPYRLVSSDQVKGPEVKVQPVASAPAPVMEAPRVQRGAWMWQRPPGALDRPAYDEKKHVASAPVVY